MAYSKASKEELTKDILFRSKGLDTWSCSCRPNHVTHFKRLWWCTQLGVAPDLELGATFWSHSMWVFQRLYHHKGLGFTPASPYKLSWQLVSWPLEDAYPEVYRFTQSIFPSADDDVITSPYNRFYSVPLPYQTCWMCPIFTEMEDIISEVCELTNWCQLSWCGKGDLVWKFNSVILACYL